jgi:class 3 adenylate cyclase
MGGRYEVELRRVFRAPRALVWAIVSDTNRVDRATGLAPPKYRWIREDGRLLRHATAEELGIRIEWIEPPYRWVEGRHVEGYRRFVKGPPTAGGFMVDLVDVEGGTEAHAKMYVEGPMWVGWLQKPKFARGLRRYFDAIQGLLDKDPDGALTGTAAEPAVVRARRLISQSYEPIASGPRTAVDEDILATRVAALGRAPIDPAIAQRLVAWIRERPDDEVAQIRPFELARIWGADRREVLRAFLYATQAGLFELSWQINCPVCRVGARLVDDLGAIDGKSHCGACEIDYAVDFARHVEAIFPVAPAIRQVVPSLYCASSPSFLPHVLAQLRIEPRTTREDDVDLPPGPIHLRTLWTARSRDLALESPPAELAITLDDGAITVTASGRAAPGAPTRVRTENATDRESVLLFERAAWESEAVLGTVIASMPEFMDLFATEAPAAGVELSVGHIALLFSDLTGSTALYERVGDARAFAIVEDHFRLMEKAISAHGGAIVKTMGDAVMASFPAARDAVRAALAMIASHDAKYRSMDLGVKVGVHAGPCLAVRANERLDYFGTTVNVSARLQAQARASELVLTEALAAEPPVRAVIEALPRRPFDALLKGIREEQRLLGIDGSVAAHAGAVSGALPDAAVPAHPGAPDDPGAPSVGSPRTSEHVAR